MRRLFYSFFLVAITVPASHSLELSLNRIAYNLLEYNRNSIDLILGVSSREDIREASISIGFHPFTLLDVQSLDANFQVSYQCEIDVLHLYVRRIASETESGTDWIKIQLSKKRGNETYFSDFGLFPIKEAQIVDRQESVVPNVHLQHGGWIYHGGDEATLEFHRLPIRVVDENHAPIAGALVIYELIGQVGMVMGRITNESGKADFVHPPDSFYPDSVYPSLDEIRTPYNVDATIKKSPYVGKYLSNRSFSARFLVFPTDSSPGFSGYYLFDRTLSFASGEGFNFAEELFVLDDSVSEIDHWCLYP